MKLRLKLNAMPVPPFQAQQDVIHQGMDFPKKNSEGLLRLHVMAEHLDRE